MRKAAPVHPNTEGPAQTDNTARGSIPEGRFTLMGGLRSDWFQAGSQAADLRRVLLAIWLARKQIKQHNAYSPGGITRRKSKYDKPCPGDRNLPYLPSVSLLWASASTAHKLLHGRKPKLCASSSKISTRMLVHKIYPLSDAFMRSRGDFHEAIGTVAAKGHCATATKEQFLENLGLMPSCVTSKKSHFSSSAQKWRARLPYQVVRIN